MFEIRKLKDVPKQVLTGINRHINISRYVPQPAKTRRSILELQGVGKSIWKDIDAQQYIDKERESWNG